MKTENLAIILTDIVGYTEATSRLSRKEQKEMLNLHNQLLFPIVRNFGGRVVKTIGDALLLVFRSPTDAMLCSMAMQDALYDFNRKTTHSQELHIRIAASLGEVRVARKDVFGEPVNLTSRIESITPEDEIYLSDAIYLAMNKAEVPCIEVGMKQLKGITEPVRIWQIPRFSRSRLVPQEVMDNEDIGELSYPFGGAHLTAQSKSIKGFDLLPSKKTFGLGLLLLALLVGGTYLLTLPTGTLTGLFQSTESAAVEEPTTVQASATSTSPVTSALAKVVNAPPVKKAKPAPVAVKKPEPVQQKSKPASTTATVSTPPPGPYAELLAKLDSGQGKEMRIAARQIAKKKVFTSEVLGRLEQGLQQHYLRNDADKVTIDALSWYCKVLGQAGDSAYLPVLELVSESATNKKLRKYALKSLVLLQRSVAK